MMHAKFLQNMSRGFRVLWILCLESLVSMYLLYEAERSQTTKLSIDSLPLKYIHVPRVILKSAFQMHDVAIFLSAIVHVPRYLGTCFLFYNTI